MQVLRSGTLLVLLAHAHVLFSLRNDGSKDDGSRTFHGLGRKSKARDRALPVATGASSSAEVPIIRGTLNSTHPWKKMIVGGTRRAGHNKFNRSVTPAEDPGGVLRLGRHSKRMKMNGAVSTPAGGHYNAVKPPSMGLEEGEEGGIRHTKEELKKVLKRARTRQNPWEPIPRPVALTSTDMPFDLFTRRPELSTFREENPWDATPITPPGSQDLGGEIKNPFYPVTSETFGAYAITSVSGVIFLVGVAGNIAILCIVCQNYYMKSISNSLLANLAVWDFALILFCLPMVVFHELTRSWLLGEFTCKVVPYVEVMVRIPPHWSSLFCF